MSDCIFCKIINGSIPTEKIYEDNDIIAFNDIHPAAPTHILIIPKKHYATLNDIPENELGIILKMYGAVQKITKKVGITDKGYRTIINTNAWAGQVVFHMHLHVLGGRHLKDDMG